MQVPDEMRKSVVFLYGMVGGELRPFGTAMFAGYPWPDDPDRKIPLFLTAQHVIAGIRQQADDDKVIVRLNTRDGADWWETPIDAWYQEDPNVDCALYLIPRTSSGGYDIVGWSLTPNRVATEDLIRTEAIGIGDEVFMVGLFRNHLGRDRNEPILRVGNIAAMPADPIKSSLGDMRAILIEARSIGGLSGSPVFVHMGFSRWREGQVMHAKGADPFYFLGLMHGHWDALETEVDHATDDAFGERINMGIGVVVPAEQIMRSISPLLERIAKLAQKRLDEQDQPVPDQAAAPPADEFGRFEDLTRKLVNTPKSELDEKRKDES